MDLFAGNFDAFGEKQAGQGAGWSDFANFDDAFAGAGGSKSEGDGSGNPALQANGSNFDDVFGEAKDHAILLEELDRVGSEEEIAPAPIDDDIANKVRGEESPYEAEPVPERDGAEESPEESSLS